jgi:uncharacterized membrane protein
MKRLCIALALLAVGLASFASPGAAAATGAAATVRITLDRSEVSTPLGGRFEFRTRIKNTGSRPVSNLVAHLNVVGLSEGIYVDPEDWSDERTRRLPSLEPGKATDVTWSVKAVTGGEAGIYVVVLPGQGEAAGAHPAVSPSLDVRISEHRTLNSGGVLWLAVGIPAALGIVTLGVRRRRRK